MRYTGINIIFWSNIRKKRISNFAGVWLGECLISQFCGFETFRRYKISRKWSKIAKMLSIKVSIKGLIFVFLRVFFYLFMIYRDCYSVFFIDRIYCYFCVCVTLCNCLCPSSYSPYSSRFSRQPYPEYRGIRSKIIFYRPSNTECNSVICFYKKEISRVYSFSEQVVAKGNSPQVTWWI